MRIKEVGIQRYGPLASLTLHFKEGIHPIYGPNESGKTLLIDALLKMLTGHGTGWYKPLDRVKETPEGYIVIEDQGMEIKLEKGQILANYLNIEPEDLRNVFIIRDSDLLIDEENKFYENVTDRISGIRTEDIRTIMKELRKVGRLTPSNQIADSRQYHKVKTKLENATSLKEDIFQYIEVTKEKRLQDLEADLLDTEFQIRNLEKRIKKLECAKKKEDFLKTEKILESSESMFAELKKIPEMTFSSLNEKFTMLEVKESNLLSLKMKEPMYKKLTFVGLLGSVLVFITIVGLQLISPLNLLIPFALLVFSIFMLILWRHIVHEFTAIERIRILLLNEGQKLDLKADTVQNLRNSLHELKQRQKFLEGKLHEELGKLKNALEIESETPENTLEQSAYSLARTKDEINFDIDILFNKTELKSAEKSLEEFKNKLDNLNKTLNEHQKMLNEFLSRARKLDFHIFLERDLELEIENIESLKELTKYLEDFINRIKEDAHLSIQALEIFEEIESEEEAKIVELFQEDNLASQIFLDVTKGKYNKVKYEPKEKLIQVIKSSGGSLSAEKLSRGARDQLYLAIRVDLGRKLLEGECGFFIMDDAFLASDEDRLKLQLNLIKELSDRGWQIIYFSVKKDMIDSLCTITDNELIELSPLS